MLRQKNIGFIETPKDIRDKYQYFTEADMSKLRGIGYQGEFTDLLSGVKNYISTF